MNQPLCDFMLKVLRPLDAEAAERLRALYTDAIDQVLQSALETLNPRHKLVIERRYALNGQPRGTVRGIASDMGIHASRVGAIERRVEDRLSGYHTVRDVLRPLVAEVPAVRNSEAWLRPREPAPRRPKAPDATVSRAEAAAYLGVTEASVDQLVENRVLWLLGGAIRVPSLRARARNMRAPAPESGSDVEAAARFYGVSVETVARWRRLGMLPE